MSENKMDSINGVGQVAGREEHIQTQEPCAQDLGNTRLNRSLSWIFLSVALISIAMAIMLFWVLLKILLWS